MAKHRAHGVHLGVCRSGVTAGVMAFLKDHTGRAQRKAGAAIFLRDERGEIACVGERLYELRRIGLLLIHVAPVRTRKIGADAPDAVADLRPVLTQRNANRLLHRRSGISWAARLLRPRRRARYREGYDPRFLSLLKAFQYRCPFASPSSRA